MHNIKNYFKIEDIDPALSTAEYLGSCFSGIIKTGLKEQLNEYIPRITAQETVYMQKAPNGKLYEIQTTCNNKILKDKLISIYKNHLSQGAKRNYYNAIMERANGICPFCSITELGYGSASLDHYLDKAKFAEFSLIPINLVPCCDRCNKIKNYITEPIIEENQLIHPYFDDIENTHWLFYRFKNETYTDYEFYVHNQDNIDEILFNRIKFQFDRLKLNALYKNKIKDIIISTAALIKICIRNEQYSLITEHLNECYNLHNAQNSNSWQTALYRELKNIPIANINPFIDIFLIT